MSRGQEITEEILALKRTVILLRKVLIPQRRIFSNINGHYSFFVNEENRPYYLDLVDNLDNILDTANTYRDLVNSSTETYYSIINGRTSEIITVLTMISIIMMPLTVITGFFGMNVPLPGADNPHYLWFFSLSMIAGGSRNGGVFPLPQMDIKKLPFPVSQEGQLCYLRVFNTDVADQFPNILNIILGGFYILIYLAPFNNGQGVVFMVFKQISHAIAVQ